MKKILNAFFLTMIALVTFSCSDVPSPYDINEGGGGEGPALIGDGTKENPYDVASAMKKQDNSEAWVMGYIVGCVKDKSIQADAVFEPPFTNAANVLIAATATEKNYKNCIPVQLTFGTDVRTALNLVDNAANLGKAVVIQGKLVAYFGVPGLKEPTAAVLDGKDIGGGTDPEPGDKDNPFGLDASNPVNSFSTDFEDLVANTDYALAGWTNVAAQGNRKWQGKTFTNTTTSGVDKYIQATAQGATAGTTYESWFITPAFTVNSIEGKKVTFDCSGAFFVATTTLKVYFLELVAGKMTQTQINIAGIPTSGDNVWTPGLSIDLTPFAGKVGFVGFQYIGIGGSGTSASYRLDNIKAGEASGGTTPDPDPVGANLVVNPSFENWTATLPTAWDAETYNTGITKSTEIKHSGANAINHTSASKTIKLQQEVDVVGGKTYRISYWYLDNDAKAKCRMWSTWVAGTATLDDNKAELQDPDNVKYSVDDPAWKQVSMTLAAPATATKFRFEVRTNKETELGGSIYFDDFEVVEVK